MSEDHSIEVSYSPAVVTVTTETVGTRYVVLVVRTFADPSDGDDLAAAHTLQHQVSVRQSDIGAFDVPAWDDDQVEDMRNIVRTVGSLATDSTKMFGRKDDLDPVLLDTGRSNRLGGLPAVAANCGITFPDRNDGTTPYTLRIADDTSTPSGPSRSTTPKAGPINDLDAYSYNSVTAAYDDDGGVTIHFGGDPDQPNYQPIVPGWNYLFRAYRPRAEILNGSWTFPQPQPTD